jgi:flagellar basal-body rod modification protein FlgD
MAIDTVSSNTYSTTSSTSTGSSSGTSLTTDDYFQLLAAQLLNQSMFDPVDNTEFISQMATFSSLSEMTRLGDLMQNSFAVSLIGKTVSAQTTDSDGNTVSAQGVVDEVFFQDGSIYLNIGGQSFGVGDLVQVSNGEV